MPLQRQRRYFNSFFKLLLHAIKKHVVVQRNKKKMLQTFQLKMPLFFFTHSLFYKVATTSLKKMKKTCKVYLNLIKS